MASVRDMISAFSEGSSFDTWSKSHDDDDTSSPYPVRYVREGEYDTDYDPVEVRRNAAEQEDADNRTSLFSSQSPVGSRIRSFFQVYDDGTVHSASLSRSPTEYTKGGSYLTGHSHSSTAEYTRSSRDTASRDRSARSAQPSMSPGRRLAQSQGGGSTSMRGASPGRWSVESRDYPHDEPAIPTTDSLTGIMDTSFETIDSNIAVPPTARGRPILEEMPSTIMEEQLSMEYNEATGHNRSLDRTEVHTSATSAFVKRSPASSQYSAGQLEDMYANIEGSPARLNVNRDTGTSSPSKARSDGSLSKTKGSIWPSPAPIKESNLHLEDGLQLTEEESILLSLKRMSQKRQVHTSSESSEGMVKSCASERSAQIALHELCSEAQAPEDVTWRNALYVLSIKPHLANAADNGWTPLHITCLGDPPEFMIRGIMVAAPESARVADNAGRLPLHLVAATSAHPDVLQLLVDEYPQAVTEFDGNGMLPLHRLLRNEGIEITIRHLRILLGQTIQQGAGGKKTKVSRRRGEHLDLSFEQVNELVSNDERHEKYVRESYPEDIQVSFKRLSQWKRKRNKLNGGEGEGQEMSMETSRENEGLNPASLPTSDACRLALHLAVLRKTNGSRRYSEDSETEEEVAHERTCMAANSAEMLRVLIAAHKDALTTRDGEGRTPLLLALCGQDSLPNQDMVELLLGRGTVGFESPPQWAGDVELHKTQDNRSTNPAMIATEDMHQLPLHVAAEQMTSKLHVLTAVYEAYPGAIHVQDIRGRTPLHLAMSNFERVQLDPRALALMLTDRVAQIKDDNGRIPYDLFIRSADRLPPFELKQRSGEISPSTVYKQFFQSSVEPKTTNFSVNSSVFLQRLRKLPPWMRRYALSAGFVQDMVHEETVQATRVFLILLNGAFLGILLLLFRLDMDHYSEALENPLHSNGVCVLSFFLLLFHIFRCSASIEAAVFVNQCLFNLMFWVDIVGPVLAFSTALFKGNWTSETVSAMGTAATGFLWVGAVSYIASWWHGMALFIGGAGRLGRLLFWPFVAATALIVGFAQMFFTLSTASTPDECDTVLGGRALCTVRDAYSTVYLLLLGTPIVAINDTDGDLTNGSIVLIATFTFLLVMLLINLIISIVIEVSRVDWEEAAAVSFWESNLVFIYLTSDLTRCLPSSMIGNAARRQPSRTRRIPNCNSGFSESLECDWEECMGYIFGGMQHRNSSFLRRPTNRSSPDSPLKIACLRMLALLIVPIWLIMGLFTLGLLWPPQVRSWVFRASKTRKTNDGDTLDYAAHHFAAIRNDLLQLKTMSYEKSRSTEQQVYELRQLILTAVDEQ